MVLLLHALVGPGNALVPGMNLLALPLTARGLCAAESQKVDQALHAKLAGVVTLGLHHGLRCRADLRALNADRIIGLRDNRRGSRALVAGDRSRLNRELITTQNRDPSIRRVRAAVGVSDRCPPGVATRRIALRHKLRRRELRACLLRSRINILSASRYRRHDHNNAQPAALIHLQCTVPLAVASALAVPLAARPPVKSTGVVTALMTLIMSLSPFSAHSLTEAQSGPQLPKNAVRFKWFINLDRN